MPFQKGNSAWSLRDTAKKNVGQFKKHNKYGGLKKEKPNSPPQLLKRMPSKRIERIKSAKTFDNNSQYILGKKNHLEKLFNFSFKKHAEFKKNCPGHLKLKHIHQNLISGTWSLACDKCQWVGEPTKLYDEYFRDGRVNKGKKNSTLNDTLGFALLSSPIGAHNFSELFLKLGLDPGSLSGLNKLLRRVGKQMVDLGEDVLKETRERTKQYTQRWIVSSDTRYNNPLFSNSTPFQYGSQAVTTTVEEVTGQHMIVHCGTFNKLCTTAERLRKKGVIVKCPGHDNCTANRQKIDSIGDEGHYGEKMANDLKAEGIDLAIACIDGDTKQKKGLKRVNEETKIQSDSRHLGESQKKKIKMCSFSEEMFPVKKKNEADLKSQFANDLTKRCTAEFNVAHKRVKKFKNDPTKMKKKLNNLFKPLPNTIVQCYLGSHEECKQHSFVCNPPKQIWPKLCLDENQKTGIYMCESDQNKVKELIGLRLGENAVEMTYLNLNTQKVEAINRKFNKTNPKNVTNVRNFPARIFSSVVDQNLGFTEATHRMHTLAQHSVCGNIKTKIKKFEDRDKLIKKKKQSRLYKNKRVAKIVELYRLHRQRRQNDDLLYRKHSGLDDGPQ